MRCHRSWCLATVLLAVTPWASRAQETHHYQADFTVAELTARRARLYDAVGAQGIAIVQGASGVPGFSVFRQSNDFYYLSGVESAHAYLLVNGRTRTTTLYLPHRDDARERSEGKSLSAEDTTLVMRLTGIDRVRGLHILERV
jgi:Xaa-Pro aminopeptidase